MSRIVELLASSLFQATLEWGGEADVSPMEITVSYVKGFQRYSTHMQKAMDLHVARQINMRVIESCEDAAMQEVVMVRKDNAPCPAQNISRHSA